MPRRKKRSSHVVSISFLVTFLALAGIYTAFYVSAVAPRIDVEQLPQSVPHYTSFWAKYVPADAEQFGFQNYTKIRLLNSSYPFQNQLLQLVKPVEAISTNDVNYFLTIVFAQPNESLDITFLNPQSYLNFQAQLQAEIGYGEQAGNATLFSVAVTVDGKVGLGWLALMPRDDAVGFAAGTTDAKQAIELSLNSSAEPATMSVLSRADVDHFLYIVGGVSNHIALGEENFPGVVRSGEETFTAVDSVAPYIYVRNVVNFANSSAALSHYSDVKQGYLGAQKLVVYGSFVMAQEQDGPDKLGADYRLVL